MINRYYITATLTTQALMRIGTGEYDSLPDAKPDDPLVSPLLLAGGKPYIPATTLKGVWKKAGNEALWGDIKNGGKMIIYDAICENAKEAKTVQSTAIDGETRTAKYGTLRSVNYLPVGTAFPIKILLENSTDMEVGALCAAISGIIYLGGNKNNGFGKCEIQDIKCYKMDDAALNTWLETGKNSFWDEILKHDINPPIKNATKSEASSVTLGITLQFQSPFLVSMPNPNKKPDDREPSLIPFEDSEGYHILPATSFRGALRAQAERINNTVGGYDTSFEKLFGTGKQAASLKFHDFNFLQGQMANYNMIAIDRFTGGVKGSATFKIQVFEEATLKGLITILKPLDAKDIKLLGHLFRDLNEGDITLGYGATKGFGVCKVHNYAEVMNCLRSKANAL
jgi:CRISPR/Cas system CSM-associated protein Csm3 (group 7 of RAMP superfamily)